MTAVTAEDFTVAARIVPLTDVIDILDGAIDYFQGRYTDCADCRRSPDGTGRHCADHDEDQRLEHAARQLRGQYTQGGQR